jgi:radical SAM protein with 4Fe4S-binding SPASM domain
MVLGNLAYDQDGRIYACDEARGHRSFSIGRVGDIDYASAVASARATELVSLSLRDDAECASCALKPLCHVSPIVSKVATGDPHPKPLTDAYCLMTMGVFDYVVYLIAERPERVQQALYILEEQG